MGLYVNGKFNREYYDRHIQGNYEYKREEPKYQIWYVEFERKLFGINMEAVAYEICTILEYTYLIPIVKRGKVWRMEFRDLMDYQDERFDNDVEKLLERLLEEGRIKDYRMGRIR